jgi:hypothetical protein
MQAGIRAAYFCCWIAAGAAHRARVGRYWLDPTEQCERP